MVIFSQHYYIIRYVCQISNRKLRLRRLEKIVNEKAEYVILIVCLIDVSATIWLPGHTDADVSPGHTYQQ